MTAPADAEILHGFRERNKGVLERLLRHLELAQGFSLALAWCPDEWTEHVLMVVLQQSQVGRVEVFRAGDCPADARFPTWLFGVVRPLRMGPGDLAVLRVSRASSEQRSHLRELNEHRNAWKRVAPHAWLLVVPSYERARAQDSTLLLGAEMPDIYSIRSGDFHFSPARLPAPIPGDDRREQVPFGVPDAQFQSAIAYLEELTPGDTPAAHALYARAVLDELADLLRRADAEQRRAIRPHLLSLQSETLPLALAGRALGALATLHWLLGDRSTSQETARRSIEVVRACLASRRLPADAVADLILWAEGLDGLEFASPDIALLQPVLRDLGTAARSALVDGGLGAARILFALGSLSARNRDLGTARAAYGDALETYRQLAAEQLQMYRADVAMTGPHDQSVRGYRVYRADVALTLNNLGIVLSDLRELGAARAAYEEALGVYRDLAAGQPQVYRADVALTLNNLGNVLRDLRELEAARAVHQEALAIRRELAAGQPEAYCAGVATSLNNLGTVLGNLRELEAARAAYQEALGVYRDLAAEQPQVYRTCVADTLNNLGNVLGDLRELDAARAAYLDALSLRRELAAAQPQVYRAGVALTLHNLGNVLRDLRELDAARAATREALGMYQDLAREQPQVYRTYVAGALDNLGSVLADLQELEEARGAYEEALAIRRELAAGQPHAYRADVALTLNNLGIVLSDLQELEAARAAHQEALAIRRELAAGQPKAYRLDVAMTLNNLGNVLRALRELGAARAAYAEALGVYRDLAAEQPQVYRSDVALTLNNLGNVLRDLREPGEAREAYEEALGVYRDLAAGQPQVYGPNLAVVERNLQRVQAEEAEDPGTQEAPTSAG